MRCPCCRQHILAPDKVMVWLDENMVVFRDKVARVRPRHAELLQVLASRYPKSLSSASVLAKVFGQQKLKDPQSSVDNLISGTRSSLDFLELGFTISASKYRGYRIDIRGDKDG